jgi:glycosyltransferase involved in cell wall biosynthesis
MNMENKRLKLGIIFNFSSQWMGGIIYIINFIKTLNFLDDKEKPEIYIFYRPDLSKFLEGLNYPYLNPIEWKFISVIKGNIKSLFIRKNVFIEEILNQYSLDVIFPMHDFPTRSKTKVKLVSWWADLQHKHYPEFFSKQQILARNIRTKLILRNCDDLVVSSQDVLNDFSRFYKLRKDMKIHVFHFVSVIDNLENVKIEEIKVKYKLPEKYFLVSNQFHKHKNHKVVLESLARLKSMDLIIHMAFTGKLPGDTNSPYLSELRKIIKSYNLEDQVTFLGVIPRNDQLQIMKYSQAVIQPSLFEGWSTVIEDAKSMQVPIIASNLNVNIEQLGKDGVFFSPQNQEELASILANFPERNMNDVFYKEYNERIKEAARTLIKILSNK